MLSEKNQLWSSWWAYEALLRSTISSKHVSDSEGLSMNHETFEQDSGIIVNELAQFIIIQLVLCFWVGVLFQCLKNKKNFSKKIKAH